MKYAKYINETKLDYAPVNKGSIMNYNLDTAAMTADGYKPVTETPKPAGYYRLIYSESENGIEYVWLDDTAAELERRKTTKYAENETVRDMYLTAPVEYADILWDADLEQKINLGYAIDTMSESDTVRWVGADGTSALENATKADLVNILGLLVQKTTYVWAVRNPQIKNLIGNAATIEALDAIVITYGE